MEKSVLIEKKSVEESDLAAPVKFLGGLRRFKAAWRAAKTELEAADLASECLAAIRLGSRQSPYSGREEARAWLQSSGGAIAALERLVSQSNPQAVDSAFGPGSMWVVFEEQNAWGWEAKGRRRWFFERGADAMFKREMRASPFAFACWAGAGECAERLWGLGGEGEARPLWDSVGGARLMELCSSLGLPPPATARALTLAMASADSGAIETALRLSGPLDQESAALCWALSKQKSEELRARLQELVLSHALNEPATGSLSSNSVSSPNKRKAL